MIIYNSERIAHRNVLQSFLSFHRKKHCNNEGYGKEWKPQTVSTYLAKLCIKNYIQMKRAGRTITYEILITEEDYKSEQAREFVAFWNNGSLKQFITAFYKDEPASKDEIEELRNAIEELEE